MRLEIDGTAYEFRFGMKFLRTINQKYSVDQQAKLMGLNSGLDVVSMNFLRRDPEMLIDVLKIANETETPKVGQDTLDGYIEVNGVDELYEEVLNTLKKSPSIGTAWKTAANQLEENLKAEENK